MQLSLDVKPWDTRSAQLANNFHRYMTNDRLSVSRASGVAFGVRLTPAGASLHSLASPTLAVDRKVEPRPSRAMSVAAVRAGPRPGASPLSPVPRTKRARRRERRGRVTAGGVVDYTG